MCTFCVKFVSCRFALVSHLRWRQCALSWKSRAATPLSVTSFKDDISDLTGSFEGREVARLIERNVADTSKFNTVALAFPGRGPIVVTIDECHR